MTRATLRLLMLGGLALAVFGSGYLNAQSMKKKDGPSVKIEDMSSQTFGHWKAEKSSKLVFEAVLPKVADSKKEDSAILTVAPYKGDFKEFVEEVKKQFAPANGKTIDEVTKQGELKAAGPAKINTVFIMGTYTDDADSSKKKEKFAMSAAVFEAKGNKYLVKMVGPYGAVMANRNDLDDWLKSFK